MLFRSHCSGGAGYGSPLDREPERIEDDVRSGFIARSQAEEEYCVAFTPDGERIDRAATERRREELRAQGV